MKIIKRINGKIVAMDTLGSRTITIKERWKRNPTVFSADETVLSKKSLTTVTKGRSNIDKKHLEVGDTVDILLFDEVLNGVSVAKVLYGDNPPPERMRDNGEFYTLDFEELDDEEAPF